MRRKLVSQLKKLNNDQLLEINKKKTTDEFDDCDPLVDYRKRSRNSDTDGSSDEEEDPVDEQDLLVMGALGQGNEPLNDELGSMDFTPVGIKAGESRFDIPGIYRRNKWKGNVIQRDDGKALTLLEDLDRAREKQEWYAEEDMRQRIVERDPNYQFMTLVAGEANTSVFKLYDQESLEALQVRERSLSQQHTAQISKRTSNIKELLEQKRELKAQLKDITDDFEKATSLRAKWEKLYKSFKNTADEFASTYSEKCYSERKRQLIQEYDDRNPKSDTELLYKLASETNDRAGRMIVPEEVVKALLNIESDEMYIFSGRGEEDGRSEMSDEEDVEPDAFLNLEQQRELNSARESGRVAYLKALNKIVARFLFDEWIRSEYPEKWRELSKIKDTQQAWRLEVDYIKNHVGVMLDADNEGDNLIRVRFYTGLLDVIMYFLENGLMTIGQNLDFTDPLSRIDSERKRNRLWNELREMKGNGPLGTMEGIYQELGGLNCLKGESDAMPNFLTDSFMIIQRSVLSKAPIDPPDPEPICDRLRIYGIHLSRQLRAKEKRYLQYTESIDAIDQNIEDASKNIVRIIQPEYPYEHRTAWLARPEHSGTVPLLSSVVAAIDKAHKSVRIFTGLGNVDIELLQRDETIRGDFASLVAIYWAQAAQRFPKQYYLSEQYKTIKREERNLLIRFKKLYSVYWAYNEEGKKIQRIRLKGEEGQTKKKPRLFKKNHDL